MNEQVTKGELLAAHTTLHIGGEAEYFVEVHNESELEAVVSDALKNKQLVHILGGGSNVLVNDRGLSGITIKLASKGIAASQSGTEVLLTAQAGELLDDVVAYAVEHGWWGIENLSHIPGTVGATPIQNVGAYGVEIQDVLEAVRVYNCELEAFESLNVEQCKFGYRDSLFKSEEGKKYIITAVTVRLTTEAKPQLSYRDLAEYFKDKPATLTLIREALIQIRSKKFPDWHTVGTAGSFFKNPIIQNEQYAELLQRYPELPGFVLPNGMVKLSLGWILDKVLSIKGYRKGNVGTYEQQALVLVAHQGATATEVISFAEMIIERIKNELGITVELEVTRM